LRAHGPHPRGAPYLALLAKLQKCSALRFTPIGQLPLRSWLFEWQTPACADLFLQGVVCYPIPATTPCMNLRKGLKGVRLFSNTSNRFGHASSATESGNLRKAQDLSRWILHDCRVLEAATGRTIWGVTAGRSLPAWQQLIELQEKAQRWGSG